MIILKLIGGIVVATLIIQGCLVWLNSITKKHEEKENDDGK